MNARDEKLVSTVLNTLPSVITSLKYGLWSIDELASFFINEKTGKPITASKAAQKVNWFREVGATLWRRDRARTCAILMFGVECQLADERAAKLASTEMPADEIEQRIEAATGRANTRLLRASDIATGRERHPADKLV